MSKMSEARKARRNAGKRPKVVLKSDSHTPPATVRRALRQEVGFVCPVVHNGVRCRSPWLEYHHFDPRWKVEPHQRPEGIIALCTAHHPQADGGAFTVEQLRAFKANASQTSGDVSAEFNWMRQDLLVMFGGICTTGFTKIFSYGNDPILWFERNENGNLLLNLHMLTTSGQPRLRVEDHDIIYRGHATDLVCPPGGKSLSVEYSNGDSASVAFIEMASIQDLEKRLKATTSLGNWKLTFPLVACEVLLDVGDAISITTKRMKIGKNGGEIRGPLLILGPNNSDVGAIDLATAGPGELEGLRKAPDVYDRR